MEVFVCRVCMISSEVFEYCNLMEKYIFKNIRLCDAFKLITGLDVSVNIVTVCADDFFYKLNKKNL